jgi:hypothetical protein
MFEWQARAGVKEIDLRLGESFNPNVHRVLAFTPLADIDRQMSEDCEFGLHFLIVAPKLLAHDAFI